MRRLCIGNGTFSMFLQERCGKPSFESSRFEPTLMAQPQKCGNESSNGWAVVMPKPALLQKPISGLKPKTTPNIWSVICDNGLKGTWKAGGWKWGTQSSAEPNPMQLMLHSPWSNHVKKKMASKGSHSSSVSISNHLMGIQTCKTKQWASALHSGKCCCFVGKP